MMIGRLAMAALTIVVLGATAANAVTTLAGQVFEDNAFVDDVSAHGSWTNPSAVVGPNIMTYAQNNPPDPQAYLLATFLDNSIVNGAGADFVLFEANGPGSPGLAGEPAKITINGITRTYATTWAGEGGAYSAYIDLDDFGVLTDHRVAMIQLWGLYSGSSGTEYMAIGALNNGAPIPAPAAIGLVALGLIGLRATRRYFGR